MAEPMNKKMLNLMILKILMERSDDKHRLKQQDIIDILEHEYGMTCDRRSVKNNIDALRNFGYEISSDRGVYLEERDFEDSELRMLIDGVLVSKGTSRPQAKRLIDKLVKLGSPSFGRQVKHVYNLPELSHSDNTLVMFNIDIISQAIEKKRQISFTYNHYNTKFKLVPKREKPYVVNPYQMVVSNGWYYLISNTASHDNISHYRIDKMTDVKITDTPSRSKREIKELVGSDLPKHLAEHIYMFSGPSVMVTLETTPTMMDALVDWFGRDFTITLQKDGKMQVMVKCNEQAMRYWVLQYIESFKVIAPESLKKTVEEILAKQAAAK